MTPEDYPEYCNVTPITPHSNATEQEIRDKVLGELLVWVKKNNINYEDADGDRLPVIVTGKIMNKIEELRTPTPEAQR